MSLLDDPATACCLPWAPTHLQAAGLCHAAATRCSRAAPNARFLPPNLKDSSDSFGILQRNILNICLFPNFLNYEIISGPSRPVTVTWTSKYRQRRGCAAYFASHTQFWQKFTFFWRVTCHEPRTGTQKASDCPINWPLACPRKRWDEPGTSATVTKIAHLSGPWLSTAGVQIWYTVLSAYTKTATFIRSYGAILEPRQDRNRRVDTPRISPNKLG